MWAFGCGVVSSGVPLAAAGRWPWPAPPWRGRWSAPRARPPTTGTTAMWTPSTSPTGPSPPAGSPADRACTSRWAGPPSPCCVAAIAGPLGVRRRAGRHAWPGPTARRRCASRRMAGGATPPARACYEGLPWFTGAAVMPAALPDGRILLLAALYSARRARHHDAERLQVGRGRPADGRRTPAGAAGRRTAPPRLACWVMARAAGRRGRPAAALGPPAAAPRSSRCCWPATAADAALPAPRPASWRPGTTAPARRCMSSA